MFYKVKPLLLEFVRSTFENHARSAPVIKSASLICKDTLRTIEENSSDLPTSFVFPPASFSRLPVSSSNVQTWREAGDKITTQRHKLSISCVESNATIDSTGVLTVKKMIRVDIKFQFA